MTLLRFRIRGRACFLRNVTDCRSYRIGEAACEDVVFGDRVCRRSFDRLARCNILEYTLLKRYAFDLREGDRLCFIIDIGCGDRERNGIAKLVCLVFDRLRNYQIIVDRRRIIRIRTVRDRQLTILGIDDHVIARRILGGVIKIHYESVAVDLCKRNACECDIIFAHKRAAAVCRNVVKRQTCDLIAFQILHRVGGDFMQLTVIDLCVAVRNQLDLHRPDDQRAGNIFNLVVAGCRSDLCIARNDLSFICACIRLFAVQGDARDVIRALQTFHKHLGVQIRRIGRIIFTLRRAGVEVHLIDDRDLKRRLIDCQRTDCVFALRVARFVRYRPREAVRAAVAHVLDAVCAFLRRCDRDLIAGAQRELRLAFRAFDRLVAVVHRVYLIGMRCCVVVPCLVCRFDVQLLLAVRSDLQLAFVLRDVIVVRLEVRAFGIDDRVRHFAFFHRRDAAGRLDIGDLAFDESVSADRNIGLRQRAAVVRLLAALTRQRHCTLVD